MDNGLGGFTPDGDEYVVVLEGDRETPLPWSNVMANAEFGTMVSASGSAFTWAGNSRENRLTPFANDPVADPTGEAIYLRDDESGAVWGATPGPLPRRADAGRWVVRQTAGVTTYQHAAEGLEQSLAVSVAAADPVKLMVLTLTNTSKAARRLSVFGYVEWCLGPPRARRAAVRDDRARSRHRRDPGAQRLQHGVPATAWRSCTRPSPRARTPATGPSSSAGIARSPGPTRSSAIA